MTASRTPTRRTAVPLHRGRLRRLDRHPETPDPGDLGAVRDWVRRQPQPRAVDLFSGAGGLGLGLREAGFSVLVGADLDSWAVETHTANVGGLGWAGDLTDPSDLLDHLDGWGIDHVELVAGGVPCQPFSRAGQSRLRDLVRAGQRGHDPRVELWRSFMSVVERLEPNAVLVENVPDLPAWDDGTVLAGLLESLAALNYTVDARVIDCFRLGIPQHRSRLFLVGLRDGHRVEWPEGAGEMVSLRDAIGDLPPVPGGQRNECIPYRPRPNSGSPFQARMRRNLPPQERGVIRDHVTRAVRPDDFEAFEQMAAGETYADIPEHLQRYRSDIFTDKYKRLSWEHLSRTITAHIAKDGYWYIHPEQHRTLSIREAARLQSFPDDWNFAGGPSHRYTQIGNAVPPLAGEAIGRAVREAMERPRRGADDEHARESLTTWHADMALADPPWRAADAAAWTALVGALLLTRGSQVQLFDRLIAVAGTPLAAATCAPETLRSAGLSRSATDRLIAVAEGVIELYAGRIPETDVELQLLPGVGDGVSGAVRSFGHGQPAILLDTGTARVAGRYYGRDERRRWQLRLDLHRLAAPIGPDPVFNRAVTAVATEVCHPATPRCPVCPLQRTCQHAHAERCAQEAT